MDGGDNDIGDGPRDGLSNDGSEKGTFAYPPLQQASCVCVCVCVCGEGGGGGGGGSVYALISLICVSSILQK